MRQVQRVVERVQVVQIDSVNVLCRSHYLPFFSRLGPYDAALLDRARDRAPRRLVEYWAHEASLIPPTTWPLLDGRMRQAEAKAWGSMRRVLAERPELVESVESEVLRRGPMTARQLEAALEHDLPRPKDNWGWNWSEVKQALEYLFWAGRISSAGRTAQFERRYAALDVVAPAPVRDAWLNRPGPEADYHALPRVAFTDPEVGSVGLTESQARAEGRPVAVGVAQVPSTTRGWIHKAGNAGVIKLVAAVEADVLVGATSAGPVGGEVLSALAVAVHARVPLTALENMIYAYPTFHRGISDALADLRRRGGAAT